LNHKDPEDHKEKMAHLTGKLLDREEVAHHIVDSAVARIKDGIQRMIWQKR
jgi:hypothetical protein